MGLSIDIAVLHDAWLALGDLDGLIAKASNAAVREAGDQSLAESELSIVLCDDVFIRGLNAQWRGKDRATNVLSFPVDATARGKALGDVVVAWETCSEEAAALGQADTDYLMHLLVHGVLHLLGYDHENDDDAATMEAAETRILAGLGIDSPYENSMAETASRVSSDP